MVKKGVLVSCNKPIYALDMGIDSDTGKRKIRFLPKRVDQYSRHVLESRYGKDILLALPCGKCLACKLDYAKNWATRCMLEVKDHEVSTFVTLTFDDEHLVKPNRDTFCAFIRRLRKDYKVRYFAVGELGEHTKRFHYHAILFGFMPEDLDPLFCSPSGEWTFTSKSFKKYWPYGNALFGEVTFASAGYVARYCMKKVKDESFIMMSTHPGIGANYITENMESIYKHDKIFGSFGSMKYVRPPRYADKLLEKKDPELLATITQRRTENCADISSAMLLSSGLRWHEQYLESKEDALGHKVRFLKRSL